MSPSTRAATPPPLAQQFTGRDDPLLTASQPLPRLHRRDAARVRHRRHEMDHAIRTLRCTIHGYAALQAAEGFQWSADPEETFDWMIRFLDRGLRTMCPPAGNAVG